MNARKLGALTVSTIGMGCMGLSHGCGDIPDRAYSVWKPSAGPTG